MYLALLRRLLEAGVDQRLTWRLFSLVKTPVKDKQSSNIELKEEKGLEEPSKRAGNQSSKVEVETARTSQKRPKPSHLTIATDPSLSGFGVEDLQIEVLDLIRHSMKSRWPAAFVFAHSERGNEGGLELVDLGRPWSTPQKGFNFSVSVAGIW